MLIIRRIVLAFLAIALLGAAPSKQEHRGELRLIHRDVEPNGEYALEIMLEDGTTSEIQFPKGHKLNPSKYRTGQKVKVHGRKTDHTMELDGDADLEPQSFLGAAPMAALGGGRKLAVVIMSFPGEGPSTDVGSARVAMQAANAFALSQSSGSAWYIGKNNPADVADFYFGVATFPRANDCNSDYSHLTDGGRNAIGDFFAWGSYDRIGYILPTIACSWSGSATIAGKEAWFNNNITLRVVGHELGHTDGHFHNHSEGCTTNQLTDGCGFQEYGNFMAMMGNNSGMIRMAEREHIGWPTAYQNVSAPGDYTVGAYDVDATPNKALKIPVPGVAGRFYWVTFNSGQGTYGAGKPIGTFVERSVSDPNGYNLLVWVSMDGDGLLQAGDMMDDFQHGLYITLKAQSANSSTVTISYTNPALPGYTYCAPKWQTCQIPVGQTATVAIGRKFTYTTVANVSGAFNCDGGPSIPGNDFVCYYKLGSATAPNAPSLLTVN